MAFFLWLELVIDGRDFTSLGFARVAATVFSIGVFGVRLMQAAGPGVIRP
ncbi:hypothetical protein [Bradyrhizobium sp. F1.13.3]